MEIRLRGSGCHLDQMGPRMCSVDRSGDCPILRGNFRSGYRVAYCNQWGICGAVVQVCKKRSSCHLGWRLGLGQRMVCQCGFMSPVSKGSFGDFDTLWLLWGFPLHCW